MPLYATSASGDIAVRLLSMTGHGEAACSDDGLLVMVEIRTINSRYFKLVVRLLEGYTSLEPRIESLVRQQVRRGTVQLGVRIEREPSPDDFQLNRTVLASYRRQLEQLHESMHIAESVPLEALLLLPGVVDERGVGKNNAESDWPIIERAVRGALENLATMRAAEGSAMAVDLASNCRQIAGALDLVEARAPQVIQSYRSRLTDRLNNLLAAHSIQISPADIVREVGVFAERCDISEEIVRLRSHVSQFEETMQNEECSGRKLEFLTQEMFREANTIGSKANDAEIAVQVIDMKTAIERMREMIQNVE